MANFRYVTQQVNPEVTVRQATPEDIASVMELLVQTAAWLKSTGSTQWSGLLAGEDSHNTPEAVRQGNVFVFEQGSHLAGTVILLRKPSGWDRDLWGESGHEGAIYVHRLAVSRLYRGRQLGKEMMNWVMNGIRFEGQDRVRLDCIADNPVLNDFYSRLGYKHLGISDSGFCKYEWLLDNAKPSGLESGSRG